MHANRHLLLAAVVAALTLAASIAHAATPLTTVRVASGLSRPVYVTAPPGDTSRVFILESRRADALGRIRILKNGVLLPTPFLTTPLLSTGSEQGLLGMAFAPDYATSGRFYISYTNASGTSILERRQVSAFPDTALSTGTILLSVTQPFANHNGGWIGFGPDGYLYCSFGDGGSGGDPGDRAQDLNVLYGKILRLDVSGAGIAIPPDNPYAGATPGRDEIWAFGLRNPWRNSFDRKTGDFVIADVGQEVMEEVNFQPAGSSGGVNYGWRCYEGTTFYLESSTIACGSCAAAGCPKQSPVHVYTHNSGRCSITGGYIYRGCAIPDLQGEYFFADYCSDQIWSARLSDGAITGLRERTAELVPGGGLTVTDISSFGEDARGEIYICDLTGEVYKIVPAARVVESDMPVLRAQMATGDSLGATSLGNAVLPGAVAFAGAGSRIRGVGFLEDATLVGCIESTPTCLTSRYRLSPFEIDYEACVDPLANTLTRRYVFRNTGGAAANLEYRDVAAAMWKGDADRVTAIPPVATGGCPRLVQYDNASPARYAGHTGSGSAGVAYAADVDTLSEIAARFAADLPFGGGTSAGPAVVGMALSFNFGSVAAGAVESVTVVTQVHVLAPTGVDATPLEIARLRLRFMGEMPFRANLAMQLELPRGGGVTVDVYDIQGRRIRSLHDGALPAGPHAIRWDGNLATGRPAASGVYFVQARADDRAESKRVVLVR